MAGRATVTIGDDVFCVCRAFLLAKKQLEERRAQARFLREQRDVSLSCW